MVVELLRVEVCVNYVLWCSSGSLHRVARFGDLYDTVAMDERTARRFTGIRFRLTG
jgi:hypothetical protein